jgi:hypothetical protein
MGSHGRVVQGSQRLRALQKLGRKSIDATDVRVLPQITGENEVEWAVKLQVVQRQLDIPAKAKAVRMLMTSKGWSQARCAKVFGVSGAAVSQWLGQVPDEEGEDEPSEVVGVDGVVQPVDREAKRKARQARPRLHPWTRDGEAYVLVRKTRARLENAAVDPQTLKGLSLEERDAVLTEVRDLSLACEEVVRALAGED